MIDIWSKVPFQKKESPETKSEIEVIFDPKNPLSNEKIKSLAKHYCDLTKESGKLENWIISEILRDLPVMSLFMEEDNDSLFKRLGQNFPLIILAIIVIILIVKI